MAANDKSEQELADEELAKQLQREFDEEAFDEDESSLQLGLAVSRVGHQISDSDSDATIEPEPWHTHLLDGLDDQSPDLFDNSDSNDNNTAEISINIKESRVEKVNSSLSKRASKSHEISDSESDGECNKHESSPPSKAHKTEQSCRNLKELPSSRILGDTQANKKKRKLSSSTCSMPSTSTVLGSGDSTDLPDRENLTQPCTEDDSKPLCRYGSKCYRKNPSHLTEFSHRDSDEDAGPPAKRRPPADLSTPRSTKPKTAAELFNEAQPLSFFVTKVSGISQKYNNSFTINIKEILSAEMGNIIASAQFNYMFEIPWLVKQYPEEFRSKPLLLVHGEDRQAKSALHAEASPFPNIRLCQAKLDILYGTHHTKMMLLLYDKGLRVVIHTCNLIERDWYQKSQGVWISPVFPKFDTSSSSTHMSGDSPTHFKRDMLEYLSAYKSHLLADWIKHIHNHDMSAARVYIVGSVPGRHVDNKKQSWGHLKLRKATEVYGYLSQYPSYRSRLAASAPIGVLQQAVSGDVHKWPVLGQFSSIGSLGADKSNWLCAEWLQSLSAVKRLQSALTSCPQLNLIFPSKDNVRLSLEGYPAGGSLPYSINVAKKQTYLHTFFHQWKSEGRGRSRACPHIKTYLRVSPDYKQTAWFLVTSANLSKAAWGALEKKGAQLMIRSYELGILFLPKQFCDKDLFEVSSSVETCLTSGDLTFPLPYDLPLTSYGKEDRPWMWDIPYTDLPDTNGNAWCPRP